MKFIYYLIALPVLAVLAWVIYVAKPLEDGISFAPYLEDCVNAKLVMAVLLLIGYTLGRFSAWFSYSPVRGELRRQRKANRTLNQEQIKLNKTVDGLKQDIVGLQEKAKKDKEIESAKKAENSKVRAFFGKFKKKKAE